MSLPREIRFNALYRLSSQVAEAVRLFEAFGLHLDQIRTSQKLAEKRRRAAVFAEQTARPGFREVIDHLRWDEMH